MDSENGGTTYVWAKKGKDVFVMNAEGKTIERLMGS
jgi:hypothetical protein